jgi:ABC-type uncharacterized transport system permease subunit
MTRTFIHILRLLKVHAYLDLMWMTRDFRYFLTCYISDAFISAAAVTGMLLLAERFNGIGEWSKFQIIFMLGYASIVRALMDTFFSYNVLCISRRLGRGQFDHTLIQPQPVWITLLTEGFTPFCGSCTLLPGIILLIWSIKHLSITLTPIWLTAATVNMAASVAIMLSFAFAWGSLAFWAPRSAEEISSSAVSIMSELKVFPLDGLGPILTTSLVTIMPVGFIGWYPCRCLTGLDNQPLAAFMTPAAALIAVLMAVTVFNRGMKHYAQTGSQRYLSWGHRS